VFTWARSARRSSLTNGMRSRSPAEPVAPRAFSGRSSIQRSACVRGRFIAGLLPFGRSSAHDGGAGSDPPYLLLWVHSAMGVHLDSGLITQFRSLARVWTRPAERLRNGVVDRQRIKHPTWWQTMRACITRATLADFSAGSIRRFLLLDDSEQLQVARRASRVNEPAAQYASSRKTIVASIHRVGRISKASRASH